MVESRVATLQGDNIGRLTRVTVVGVKIQHKYNKYINLLTVTRSTSP